MGMVGSWLRADELVLQFLDAGGHLVFDFLRLRIGGVELDVPAHFAFSMGRVCGADAIAVLVLDDNPDPVSDLEVMEFVVSGAFCLFLLWFSCVKEFFLPPPTACCIVNISLRQAFRFLQQLRNYIIALFLYVYEPGS